MDEILFITAFKDIKRDEWKFIPRTVEDYCKSFIFLTQNIEYNLVVFLERNLIKHLISLYTFKSNIIFKDLDEVETFFNLYINSQSSIIKSEEYIKKILSDRRDAPEHWCAEYNLINHSKINFVSHAKKIFPNYKFYSWIDFGHRNTYENIPRNIDVKKLPKKIIYITISEPPSIKILPEIQLNSHTIYLAGSSFIIHTSLVSFLEEKFKEKILELENKNIVDDDQAVILQIYFDHKEKFQLLHTGRWFSLFSELKSL